MHYIKYKYFVKFFFILFLYFRNNFNLVTFFLVILDIKDQRTFSVPADGNHVEVEFKQNKPWQTIEYDKNGVVA